MFPPSGQLPCLADRVRRILTARGLSLADVSRASRTPRADRLGHIPHNFYSFLEKRSFSPSVYQLRTLSEASGYRLVDWLAVFGLSLDDVSRFQLSFPAYRTVELDALVYRPDARSPWLYDLEEPDFSVPLVPLSRWVAAGVTDQTDPVNEAPAGLYRYVKIGSQDAREFPELLPGSIVRVRLDVDRAHGPAHGKISPTILYLVRHGRGLTCTRILQPESERIVLCSRQLPYAPIELTLGTEALIVGVADLEFRPLRQIHEPVVSAKLERPQTAAPLPIRAKGNHAGQFIERARKESGLSFREASQRTWQIARELGDRRYYCSPGSLSDYETRKAPPRHIHKWISICAVYFASVAEFFETCNVALQSAGTLPMPRDLLEASPKDEARQGAGSRFLEHVQKQLGPLPFFLARGAPSLFELRSLSVRDVFWVGSAKETTCPALANALLLIVDRRQKSPKPSLKSPVWAQPIYVLQQRGGNYLCGVCRLERGAFTLCSCVPYRIKVLRLRNRVDAEVVGRVVGVVRRLA